MFFMATIQPENLAGEIEKILNEYGDECVDALSESIEETAKEAQKELKHFNQGRKTWRNYPKGWSVKIEKSRLSTEGVVYNSNHYQLTHLLEFGHATRNGGRTAAFPHIAEVNEFAQKDVLERLQRKLEK